MSSNTTSTIGIVGGTGDLGRGLTLRLAKAGHAVLVGSRKPEQAVEAAEALTAHLDAGARAAVFGGTAARFYGVDAA